MSTESQIKANRRNAQKSTGPKTAEGKAIVAQNALKHGLFAHGNVIQCEKQADFDCFRDELLASLAPVGGVEAMNELEKLRCVREMEESEATNAEHVIPKACGFEYATHRGRDAHETQGRDALATEAATRSGMKWAEFEKQTQSSLSAASANSAVNEKQSQFALAHANVKPSGKRGYEDGARSGISSNKAKQTQLQPLSPPNDAAKGEKRTSRASHRCY